MSDDTQELMESAEMELGASFDETDYFHCGDY